MEATRNQGYFLLGDSLNTTVTVIGTLQNSIVNYNTLQLTYLLIVGIAAQVRDLYILPDQFSVLATKGKL
jgi:hypothetical protein